MSSRPVSPRSILFVVPRFHTNLVGAVRALRGAGHRVAIFAAGVGPGEDHGDVVPRIFPAGVDPAAVARALDAAGPDIVLLREARPLSDLVARAVRRRRIRTFAYDQRPLTHRAPLSRRLKRWMRGQPLRRVTPVPGLPGDGSRDPRAHLLPWPVFGDADPAPPPRQAGAVSVLCVGKLAQERKNHDRLIAALDGLAHAPPWRLTIVGSSTQNASGVSADRIRAFSDRAARSVPGREVRVSADIPYAKMPDLYRRHDICVLPSRAEPLGTAPLEAMAFGCIPVIARDAGAAGYVDPGENGLLVDMDAPDDLPAIMQRLLSRPEDLPRLSRAAACTARARFGPDAFLQAFHRLWEDGPR